MIEYLKVGQLVANDQHVAIVQFVSRSDKYFCGVVVQVLSEDDPEQNHLGKYLNRYDYHDYKILDRKEVAIVDAKEPVWKFGDLVTVSSSAYKGILDGMGVVISEEPTSTPRVWFKKYSTWETISGWSLSKYLKPTDDSVDDVIEQDEEDR